MIVSKSFCAASWLCFLCLRLYQLAFCLDIVLFHVIICRSNARLSSVSPPHSRILIWFLKKTLSSIWHRTRCKCSQHNQKKESAANKKKNTCKSRKHFRQFDIAHAANVQNTTEKRNALQKKKKHLQIKKTLSSIWQRTRFKCSQHNQKKKRAAKKKKPPANQENTFVNLTTHTLQMLTTQPKKETGY